MHGLKNGHGQISLKVPNIKFDFDVRFLMYLYLLTKPNIEIEIKNYKFLSWRASEYLNSKSILIKLFATALCKLIHRSRIRR